MNSEIPQIIGYVKFVILFVQRVLGCLAFAPVAVLLSTLATRAVSQPVHHPCGEIILQGFVLPVALIIMNTVTAQIKGSAKLVIIVV